MSQVLIIMLASFAATMGGPAHHALGGLSQRLSRAATLPVLAVTTGAVATSVMVVAGAWLSDLLEGLPGSLIAGAGLILAGIALVRPVSPQLPCEPTRSHGAIALALFAKQICDAPRWLAFAGAAAVAAPLSVGAGVIAGSTLGIISGWCAPQITQNAPLLQSMRRGFAVLVLGAAIYVIWAGFD